ncbi:MAG TPA: prenyltransferase [Flavobacteriales bacterium]|nr:prenyltransferase [Flavobacteriales bacterium]
MSISDLCGTIRVHQWVKNLFIFLPAFFGQALSLDSLLPLTLAFFSFSLSASAVYIFNDIIDASSDRLHKQKKNRPIASGAIDKKAALFLAGILVTVSLSMAYFLDNLFFAACIVYLIQNILYSIWLKKLSLIDITIISLGFLLRLFAGGVIVGIPVSNWMYIMAFLLAMLLALGKRRDDLLILKNEGHRMSQAIDGYNLGFVNMISVMLSGIIVVSYIMYTLSPDVMERVGSPYVYVTSLFVFLGVLRYLQLALVYDNTGSPTLILLSDNPVRLSVLGWLITFGYLLYF